jgi:hypothetical protein
MRVLRALHQTGQASLVALRINEKPPSQHHQEGEALEKVNIRRQDISSDGISPGHLNKLRVKDLPEDTVVVFFSIVLDFLSAGLRTKYRYLRRLENRVGL